LNCYDADERMLPHLTNGTFHRLRIIEGVPQKAPESASELPRTASQGPFIPRRLIGEAPIEKDGSFNVEVPADTPVLLQTLDDRGLALGTCGWLWVKQKETRACIGCHEDPELTPENQYVLALRRPSNRLTLPPAGRRSVAFRETIAPMLKNRCAASDCHGGRDTPLHLPLASEPPNSNDLQRAYASLLVLKDKDAADHLSPVPQPGKYIDAGRARTSYLIWQLFGADTSRPWDRNLDEPATGERKINQMPPPGKGGPLKSEEIRTFVEWIDLGAQWEAVHAADQPPATKQAQSR
jgi:hypothetical protein